MDVLHFSSFCLPLFTVIFSILLQLKSPHLPHSFRPLLPCCTVAHSLDALNVQTVNCIGKKWKFCNKFCIISKMARREIRVASLMLCLDEKPKQCTIPPLMWLWLCLCAKSWFCHSMLHSERASERARVRERKDDGQNVPNYFRPKWCWPMMEGSK